MKNISRSKLSFSYLAAGAMFALSVTTAANAFAESHEGNAAPHAAAHTSGPAHAPAPSHAEHAPGPAGHPAPGAAAARYTSPHWRLDNRYNHDRYYPARGYVVNVLPVGNIGITFGGVRYYHHAGVWFRSRGPRYIVVAPPFGIVIPFLPYGYSTVWVGRDPYYYADDVYYVSSPGGYRVVQAPPVDDIIVEQQMPTSVIANSAPGAPAPQTLSAPPVVTGGSAPANVKQATITPETLFVYPRTGQTATQTSFDRIECDRWAVSQTGFEPSQPSNDPARRAIFLRAAAACLEGRGYTVK